MIQHTKTSRTNRRQRRGSVLVESALVLPVVLLLILGVMEYARYLMTLHVFNNAAREGCRYAVTHTNPVVLGGVTYGNATSDVTNVVSNMLAGQSLSSQSVTVFPSDSTGNSTGSWPNVSAEQCVCVQITGNFSFMVPKLIGLPSSLPVTIKVVMRAEGN